MNSYGVFRGVMGLEGHIMSNFSFLLGQDDYEQFAIPCVEAEKAFSISPTMCAMATRKAFELAVKWVYAADRSIDFRKRIPGRKQSFMAVACETMSESLPSKRP